MAARVQQLLGRARGLVEPTLGRGANEVAHRFEDLMQKNAEYVVKDPAQANKLLRQWTFTQLARIPPGIQHSKEEAAVLKHKLANYRDLPLTEVAQYVGFAAEVYAWFCIGEIVGRGFGLTGYV